MTPLDTKLLRPTISIVRELVKDKKTVLKIATSLFLFVGLLTSVVLVQQNQDIREHAQTGSVVTVGCQDNGITITSGEKKFYSPGERINLTIRGKEFNSSAPKLTNIVLWYAPANGNLRTTATSAENWKNTNITGSYNASTKSWTGTWVLPTEDGEYILAPNFIQSDNYACSSNPGYLCPNCHTGYQFDRSSAQRIPRETYSCKGCHKTFVVSRTASNPGGYDVKSYYNFSPGYNWVYKGYNFTESTPQEFYSYFSIEEKSSICGHTVLPLRFTKSNLYGHWGPKGHNNLEGVYNQRHLLTYFQSGERWSDRTLGLLFHKSYNFPSTSTNPISELGVYNPIDGLSLRHFSEDTNRNFQNNYFSPYLWGENGATEGYEYSQTNIAYVNSLTKLATLREKYPKLTDQQLFCKLDYEMSGNGAWRMAYLSDNLSNTDNYGGKVFNYGLYTGSLMRLRVYESWGGGSTREDLFMVPNLGIVRMDKKGGASQDTGRITNPDYIMSLVSYYIGGDLKINFTDLNSNPLPSNRVARGGSYKIKVKSKDRQGNFTVPYSGWLEVRRCITSSPSIECAPYDPANPTANGWAAFKWGRWVWLGEATETLSSSIAVGTRHAYYRPFINTAPGDYTGEVSISKTELPWGNETHLTIY